MTRNQRIGIGGTVAIAVAAFLAFGVFGIHTAFIDNEVSEANPFADQLIETAPAPPAAEPAAPEPIDPEPINPEPTAPATTTNLPEGVWVDPEPPETNSDPEPVAPQPVTEEVATAEPVAEQPAESGEPVVRLLGSNNGVLVDHDHSGEGTINVLSNGTQTFLRFEDDFAIDNGPDLNVYLVRGVSADGPAGQFDDDFIDLGDLKGNIGAQNYELPEGVDVTEYNTVVIWCVRFGVAFNAADLNS